MAHIRFNFHHISINVKNIKASKSFYRKLGFSDLFTYHDNDVVIEHLDNNGIILELFCYNNVCDYTYDPTQLKKHCKIIGCEHFSLCVSDINKAYVSLRTFVEKGTSITIGRTGIKYFFVVDPDGIRIEIVEDNRRGKNNEK